MARKPKAAKEENPDTGESETKTEANGIGHNGPVELTDEQRMALTFSHKKSYQTALAKKKEADAAFKNVCKLAKSELGPGAVADIKDMIELETDDGDEKFRTEVERRLRVARWMGASIGSQFDLFDTSGVPADERAFDEGKRDGMEGKPRNSSYDTTLPQHGAYMDGYNAGQKAIFAIQKNEDDEVFDGAAPPPVDGVDQIEDAPLEAA